MLMAAVTMVHASDSTIQEQHLGEASVTALRNTALRSSAPSQSVSAGEIGQRGAVSLAEVLSTLAGVSVKDYGGIGGLKTVNIRGFGAQHTGLCIDGIAITDSQNGQVDVGRYNLDNVESVRVDIGGTDDVFRPARLAGYVGVVSIASTATSPKGEDDASADGQRTKTDGTALVRCGSFGTWSPHLQFRHQATDRWQVAGAADYLHSEGNYPFRLRNGLLVTDEVRLNSQTSQLSAEARALGSLGRAGTLQLKAHAYDSSRGLPGSVVLYTQHPTEHLWNRTLSCSALHRIDLGQWRVMTSLACRGDLTRYLDTSAQHVPSSAIDDPAEADRYVQQQAALSSVALWQMSPEWSVSLAEDLDVAHLVSNIPEAVQPTRETSFTALSGKYASPRLTAVATVLGIVSMEQVRSGHAAPGRTRLCPTASVVYALGEGWRLRASYKESYRLPTFNDLYYLRVGNRSLRPERARQTNLGATFEARGAGWTFGATADAYYNDVHDKIVAVPSLFVWSMRNVGWVVMQGADVSAALAVDVGRRMRLSLAANYSVQHAIDVTDKAAKNYRHQIPYTPRHTGSAVLTFVTPWVTMSYTAMVVDERYSLAQNTEAYRIAPYADHSVSLNRTFALRGTWRLHVSAEALNLGGTNYEIIKYYPMPGRQYRVSAKVSF